jgi:endonuclease YncB( thermonuclease family)
MIRALTLIVLGTASFAAVYVLVPPRDTPTDVPEATAVPSSAAPAAEIEIAPASPQEAAMGAEDPMAAVGFELRPGAGQVMPESDAQQAVRDVTPDNMTAAPRVTGTLARVDPPGAAPPKERTERLFNPIVVAAGTIKVRDREIHLAGVVAPEFAKSCGKGATAWPCGRLARAALRSFIRGRAIECQIPAGVSKIPDPATCVVGGDDISEWLVAQGWAKRNGDAFQEAENRARGAKLGLWSDGRPGAQASTVVRG